MQKNGTSKGIPTRCLKEVSDICSPFLGQIWIYEIINKTLPTNLKLANATPVIKKKDCTITLFRLGVGFSRSENLEIFTWGTFEGIFTRRIDNHKNYKNR